MLSAKSATGEALEGVEHHWPGRRPRVDELEVPDPVEEAQLRGRLRGVSTRQFGPERWRRPSRAPRRQALTAPEGGTGPRGRSGRGPGRARRREAPAPPPSPDRAGMPRRGRRPVPAPRRPRTRQAAADSRTTAPGVRRRSARPGLSSSHRRPCRPHRRPVPARGQPRARRRRRSQASPAVAGPAVLRGGDDKSGIGEPVCHGPGVFRSQATRQNPPCSRTTSGALVRKGSLRSTSWSSRGP